MSKETGGPAFPLPLGGETVEGQEGMTLRDYFAAKAMHAIITGTSDRFSLGKDHQETNSAIANVAYVVADAMIAARGQ